MVHEPEIVTDFGDLNRTMVRISDLRRMSKQASFLLRNKVKFKDLKGRAIVVYHAGLWELLEFLGFWEFHSTNLSKKLIYRYQVEAFLHYTNNKKTKPGWTQLIGVPYLDPNRPTCRKYEKEIHHLDSNPQNDSPENLTYVTPAENKLLAYLVGNLYGGVVKSWAFTLRPFEEFLPLLQATAKKTLGVELPFKGLQQQYARFKLRCVLKQNT